MTALLIKYLDTHTSHHHENPTTSVKTLKQLALAELKELLPWVDDVRTALRLSEPELDTPITEDAHLERILAASLRRSPSEEPPVIHCQMLLLKKPVLQPGSEISRSMEAQESTGNSLATSEELRLTPAEPIAPLSIEEEAKVACPFEESREEEEEEKEAADIE